MAKIEMDISEYEAMKENKKLLEDSLKKERELQTQIEELTKEKVKALEDAKMKVVKITKSEVTEHLLRKRTDESYIFRELLHAIGVDYRYVQYKPDYIHIDHLQNAFFEKVTSHSFPVDETTTHGLDEIKAEIRADLQSKLDANIKSKLEKAEQVLSKNSELIISNKELLKENESLLDKNKALVDNCDKYKEEADNAKASIESLDAIKTLLKGGYGFTGKAKLLDAIISKLADKPKVGGQNY